MLQSIRGFHPRLPSNALVFYQSSFEWMSVSPRDKVLLQHYKLNKIIKTRLVVNNEEASCSYFCGVIYQHKQYYSIKLRSRQRLGRPFW